MRFTVEQWAPEYGVASDPDLLQKATASDPGVEVSPDSWTPLLPQVEPAVDVLFVDGVRRVDASLWIDQGQATPVLGLAASYAAGAVRSNGTAKVVAAEVRRGLFTTASGAEDIITRHSTYRVAPTHGITPEQLWLGLQQRMGELEGEVAAKHPEVDLVVVDGPLSHRRHAAGAVGYVKSHHVEYLPEELQPVRHHLPVGRRTPLFLTTTSWSRFSWYMRLAAADGPMGGLVRCEVEADRTVGAVALIADRATATLARFASQPHKDPRAPQNLYPIGGLERHLRHRLGDPLLLYRALRQSAKRT
jgi:hypothetical protein